MSGTKKKWEWMRDRRKARRGAEVRNQVIVQCYVHSPGERDPSAQIRDCGLGLDFE